ncbi:MAG: GNAT family N-acetyltransferase [Clostridia bacterium]|nr:GNAT family N-acetyltransferase [Clostridia bacterium]
MNSKSFCEDKFNKFYALLQDGLLREEYRSMTRQKELFQNDAYKVLFCCKDEQIVGVMALWELDNFVFIEHFVVKSEFRGQKIGSKMLGFINSHFDKNVILEVELPYNEINKRRICFYERNGFFYNDFEYYQIPLNPLDNPLELRIMSSFKSLNKDEFSQVKSTLYDKIYNYKKMLK